MQHVGLTRTIHIPVDAAGHEQRRQRRYLFGRPTSLLEQVFRDRDPLLYGPLPEFERVAVKPFIHPMRGEAAGADPAPDRCFRHVEVRCGLA